MAGCKWYIIMTPPGQDNILMVNSLVVDFYNQINLLYGSITEFCSPQSCPEMKATDECVIVYRISKGKSAANEVDDF